MKSIYSDHKERVIKKLENLVFTVKNKGLYFIQVSAKTKNEKQMGGTDDEDLRIEVNKRKFPQLANSERYFDSPAAFSGGTSKGLTKTVLFFLWFESGEHHLSLIPDISATLVRIDIFQAAEDSDLSELNLPLNNSAEDGDRRDWITFVLVDTSLSSFTVELTLTRRFLDSDDVKIVIDDSIKRSNQNRRQKFWYFIASLIRGEKQSEKFVVDLPPGMHYLEFWADRMPKLEKITFLNLTFKILATIQEKIEYKSQQFDFNPKMMLRLAKRESQFDSGATSGAGAKGLFQLTDITIKQIKELGFEISDPYDIDQNIEGGFIYFNWLYKRYENQKDQIKKTLAAWNWGLSYIQVKGEFNFEGLPDGVKKFINDVLGDYDF
ncbi:MAG: lytic transglycosylase domain-containing protein [Patescibacteria group bacterium]